MYSYPKKWETCTDPVRVEIPCPAALIKIVPGDLEGYMSKDVKMVK